MFMMGCVIFFSVLLLMIKLPQRMLLRMLHYDLLIDFSVSFLVLFLHWGSFEGVMVATIAGLMTSVATSGAKRLFGYIKGRMYYPGYMKLHLGAN